MSGQIHALDSTSVGRDIKTVEYGTFQLFGNHNNKRYKMYMKLNPGLLCQKQHSTQQDSFHYQIRLKI